MKPSSNLFSHNPISRQVVNPRKFISSVFCSNFYSIFILPISGVILYRSAKGQMCDMVFRTGVGPAHSMGLLGPEPVPSRLLLFSTLKFPSPLAPHDLSKTQAKWGLQAQSAFFLPKDAHFDALISPRIWTLISRILYRFQPMKQISIWFNWRQIVRQIHHQPPMCGRFLSCFELTGLSRGEALCSQSFFRSLCRPIFPASVTFWGFVISLD